MIPFFSDLLEIWENRLCSFEPGSKVLSRQLAWRSGLQ